jgi:enterochelin esterase family protein
MALVTGLAILAMVHTTGSRAGELLIDRTLPSPALDGEIRYSVYLPSSAGMSDVRFPVIYLLHGLGGGQGEWLKGGQVKDVLDRLIGKGAIGPVIAVMPEAGKSWYVDSRRFGGPGDYETAIVRDLVDGIDSTYPTLAEARHRGIAGISMGGHGALRLAFAYPDVFSAVAALSPGIWLPGGVSERSGPATEAPADREKWYPRTTGATFDLDVFNAQSPFALVDDVARLERPPAIFLAVGDDDYWKLHDGTVEMYIELRRVGLTPELRVANGAHDWKYWRRVTGEALRFLDSAIRRQ